MSDEIKPEIINCHTHIITSRSLPWLLFTWPLPIPIIPILSSKYTRWLITIPLRVIGWIASRFNWDIIEVRWGRLYSLAKQAEVCEGKQEQALIRLQNFYPPGTKFIVLSLDTQFMYQGRKDKPSRCISQTYEQQIEELINLIGNKKYKDTIYPFLAIDPRREWDRSKVEEYIKQGFYGIKFYPSHGYEPCCDEYPLMQEVFDYLEKEQIPIIAHCTKTGLRGYPHKKNGKEFADPDNFET